MISRTLVPSRAAEFSPPKRINTTLPTALVHSALILTTSITLSHCHTSGINATRSIRQPFSRHARHGLLKEQLQPHKPNLTGACFPNLSSLPWMTVSAIPVPDLPVIADDQYIPLHPCSIVHLLYPPLEYGMSHEPFEMQIKPVK